MQVTNVTKNTSLEFKKIVVSQKLQIIGGTFIQWLKYKLEKW